MLYSALRSGVKGRRGVKVVKRLLEPEIVGGSEGNGGLPFENGTWLLKDPLRKTQVDSAKPSYE